MGSLGLALLCLIADGLEPPMLCLVLHASCAREPLAPGGAVSFAADAVDGDSCLALAEREHRRCRNPAHATVVAVWAARAAVEASASDPERILHLVLRTPQQQQQQQQQPARMRAFPAEGCWVKPPARCLRQATLSAPRHSGNGSLGGFVRADSDGALGVVATAFSLSPMLLGGAEEEQSAARCLWRAQWLHHHCLAPLGDVTSALFAPSAELVHFPAAYTAATAPVETLAAIVATAGAGRWWSALVAIERLQAAAEAPREAAGREKERAFMKWIRANGGLVGRVTVATNAHSSRGLRATAPIPRGTAVLHVPNTLVLNARVALHASQPFARYAARAAASALPASRPADCTVLALFLAFERTVRSAKSDWAPLLAMLPTEFDLPSTWGNEGGGGGGGVRAHGGGTATTAGGGAAALALALDGGAPSLAQLLTAEMERMRDQRGPGAAIWATGYVAEFADAITRDFAGEAATGAFRDRFRRAMVWAERVIETRAWGRCDGLPGDCHLIPLLDMVNHHPNASRIVIHAAGAAAAAALAAEPGDYAAALAIAAEPGDNLTFLGHGVLAPWALEPGDEVFVSYHVMDAPHILATAAAASKEQQQQQQQQQPLSGAMAMGSSCRGTELVTFGFVTDSTAVPDCVSLRARLPMSVEVEVHGGSAAAATELRTAKLALLNSTAAVLAGGYFTAELRRVAANRHAFELPPPLLSLVRIAHISTAAELAAASAVVARGTSPVPQLSLGSEAAALEALRDLLAAARADYRHPMAVDEARVAAAVAAGRPLVRELAVVRVRLGEQQVVVQAQEKVAELLAGIAAAAAAAAAAAKRDGFQTF